ncbi:hypothetical protein ABID58_002438 [Bradyrhizobium sp. S3.2.6]|uniref:hypothetical protein n=1 Tax=Bradyrhizobium sp. S3.2.6 TaxID=3156428 RepID=UPI003399A445
MTKMVQQQIDQLTCDIDLAREAMRIEQDRYNREHFTWTSQDVDDWRTASQSDSDQLREMLEERDRLRGQLT